MANLTKPLDESAFSIIGVGLMGASLAMALRDKVCALCGFDSDPVTRALAAATPDQGIDRVADTLPDALLDADVIVLATPARTILSLLAELHEIGASLKPGALIIDLGSTKSEIVAAMRSLPPHLYAIGGHPMCGKETSGFSAADPTLYAGCTFVLCDAGRSQPDHNTLAESLVRAVGGNPYWLDATLHDQYVAIISHLPYLLSMGLVAQVANDASRDTLFALAATGFRDTTRLAGSALAMMGDVMATNTDAIWRALAGLQEQLTALLAAFVNDAPPDRAWLSATREERRAWGEAFAKRKENPQNPKQGS